MNDADSSEVAQGKFGSTDRVPAEAIVGAWKVDADGNISGVFIENKNYDGGGPALNERYRE
jgi:hypothetical protein